MKYHQEFPGRSVVIEHEETWPLTITDEGQIRIFLAGEERLTLTPTKSMWGYIATRAVEQLKKKD